MGQICVELGPRDAAELASKSFGLPVTPVKSLNSRKFSRMALHIETLVILVAKRALRAGEWAAGSCRTSLDYEAEPAAHSGCARYRLPTLLLAGVGDQIGPDAEQDIPTSRHPSLTECPASSPRFLLSILSTRSRRHRSERQQCGNEHSTTDRKTRGPTP